MTKRRRRRNRGVYWVVVLVLLVIAGIIGFKVWEGYFKDDKPPVDDSSEIEDKSDEEENPEEIDPEEKEEVLEEEPLEKKTEQFDGNDPNLNNELTGVITYVGVSGGNLIIRVNIDQYLASGNCRLELLQDDNVIYGEVVEIIDSAATATCKGFNVATSGIGNGKTNINILLTSEGKIGIIKGEVNL